MNDYWGTRVSSIESHKSYRPLTVMTFRWNYYYGELETFGYHLVNILLHGICTCLITVYAKQNQETLFTILGGTSKNDRTYIWVGLLFASHPVHTEAISSVVGRAEPLSCIFVLISLIMYTPRKNRSSITNVLFICIFGFISMLCKESGAMVIVVCCLFDIVDWIGFGKLSVQNIRLLNICMFMLFFACTIYFRFYVTSTNFSPTFSDVDNYIHYIKKPVNRVLTYGYLHVKYIIQLVFPMYLSCDWSYKSFATIDSIYDVRNIATCVIYFFVLGVLFVYFGIYCNGNSSFTYPIIIGVAFFLPASNMFFPVATVLAERVLYLPSIGFCIILPNLLHLILINIQHLKTRAKNVGKNSGKKDNYTTNTIGNVQVSTIKHSILLTICLCYSWKTYTRNDDWNTPLKLFKSATEVVPNSCKAWICLGTAYKELGDYDKARQMVSKSLEIKSDFAGAYYLLGTMEEDLGNIDEAIRNFELTIQHSLYTEFKPDMLRIALNNVGVMYWKKKKNPKQGLHAFTEGLKLSPNNYALNANIGELYSNLGKFNLAIKHYNIAQAQKPNSNADLINNLAIAIYQKNIQKGGEERGNMVLPKVLSLYQQAISINKYHYNSNLNIGKIFYRKKQFENVILHLNNALLDKDIKEFEKNYAEVYDLLGRAYLHSQNYQEAIRILSMGIAEVQKRSHLHNMNSDSRMLKRLQGNLQAAKSVVAN